jgi:hypothetical protein
LLFLTNFSKGEFHSKWVFRARNQTWTAKRLSVFQEWFNSGSIAKDVGFGIVNTNLNTTIQKIIGALALNTTCQGELINAIGFADGKLIHAEATISRLNTAYRPPLVGMISKLGGRGFGGPWVCKGNYICGVSSFQGGQVLWSPGFDNKVLSLQRYAINLH